ncbi:TIGR02265 family protein [bacterium]|nr:TIGR02265 family protein [bacterium]
MTMQVRGAVLLARKAFVSKHFGMQAWEKVFETLPEEDQIVFKGMIVHSGWYSFELAEELDKAIVQELGHGDLKVFEKIGSQSAKENLAGVHKTFLTPGDPQAFMAQANSIYRFYYNTGHRTWEKTGPKSGVLTTHGAETFSAIDCLTVIGWHRTALEMCGAKNVRIQEEECRARGGKVCRYQISWD